MLHLKPTLLSLALIMATQGAMAMDMNSTSQTNLGIASQMEGAPTMRACKRCHHGDKLWTELGLSDDQKTQMKALFESKRPQREAFRTQFEGILTPEQKAQLQQMKETRQANQGPHKRGEFLGQMNFSAEQKAQLKTLRAAHKAQWKETHQQMMAILTPEQQGKLKTLKEQRKSRWQKRHHKAEWNAEQDS